MMEIVWLRDPNFKSSMTYTKSLGPLSLIDGFLFGIVFIFCYGLDLLVVVFLFLSAFSFFLSSIICTFVFVSLYYLVCSSNKFILLFPFGFSIRFVLSFASLPVSTTLVGHMSTTVRSFFFFSSCNLIFYPLHSPPFFKNISLKVDNSPYRTLSQKYP